MKVPMKKLVTKSAVVAGCMVLLALGGVAPSAAREPRKKFRAGPPTGNLLLSRSIYTAPASTVVVGQALPGGGIAVADGAYPEVFKNAKIDGSFGVTSPIFIDRNAISGGSLVPLATLAVPTDQMATSFSSKSEMALHLSTDGTQVTLMGYIAPVPALDVSNSNTPNHVDTTNPVVDLKTGLPLVVQRAIATIDAQGLGATVQVTPVNTYSGNNGRSAIIDSAQGVIFTAGNAGNGSSPEPVSIVSNTGVQMVKVGGGPECQVVGTPINEPPPGSIFGPKNGFQFGFAVQLVGFPADKSGKDDNFRGLTIFENTLYVTKGSGGNGINTVYQVGTQGTLPTSLTAASTPITILNGLPATLASGVGAQNPFGIWFADANTLYVADEGVGSAGANPNAGLQKWILQAGVWNRAYVLQAGLNHGVQYAVPGLPAAINPAPDGLRSLTGRVNGDGTVTLWAVTSTVSASGDQGADPNQLVTITDTLSNTTASGESFQLVRTAGFGEVLRGVEFVPLSATVYASNLLQSALTAIQALPGSDFKNNGQQQSLISVLSGIISDLQNGTVGTGIENRIENVIKKSGAISDPAAQAAILTQLNAALAVFSEE
jgi:hypothetical protein